MCLGTNQCLFDSFQLELIKLCSSLLFLMYQLKNKEHMGLFPSIICWPVSMTTVSVLMLCVGDCPYLMQRHLCFQTETHWPNYPHSGTDTHRVIGVSLCRAAVTCLILDSVIRGDAQHIQSFKAFLSSHCHIVLTAESIPHRQTSGPGSGQGMELL